jgi:hypothetical protein
MRLIEILLFFSHLLILKLESFGFELIWVFEFIKEFIIDFYFIINDWKNSFLGKDFYFLLLKWLELLH